MNEQEWLTRNAPKAMLRFVEKKASARQLRLFACACCRLVWDQLTDERARQAVEVGERFADGQATELERAEASGRANQYHKSCAYGTQEQTAATAAVWAATRAGGNLAFAAEVCSHNARCLARGGKVLKAQSDAMRDIMGNPFRAVALKELWRTPEVRGLARTIFDERAFEQLPILADALQDAGCEEVQILAHCRSKGRHVRGCWVVDLMLGKSGFTTGEPGA